MVGHCSCKSDYHDQKYGAGIRVMNRLENGKLRCTVCGKETDAPAAKGQVKEKKQ